MLGTASGTYSVTVNVSGCASAGTFGLTERGLRWAPFERLEKEEEDRAVEGEPSGQAQDLPNQDHCSLPRGCAQAAIIARCRRWRSTRRVSS